MSLNVETGAGSSVSESYVSVAEVDSYHLLRGNTTWATITTAEKEEACRRAIDYMQQVYHGQWLGYRKNDTQALDWPRSLVPRDDVYGYAYYSDSAIPQILKNAQCELAWKAAHGELAPDLGQKVSREKIDVIEIEYEKGSTQYIRYRAIDNLLSSLLTGRSSGVFKQVVRA